MSILVYYMNPDSGSQYSFPSAEHFSDDQLLPALARCEVLRTLGRSHVCISSELGDSIGKPGVTSIKDGKTPDGHTYEWSKKQRGDGPSNQ